MPHVDAVEIRMTKRYGHIGSLALREAADVLGRFEIPAGFRKKSPVGRGGKCQGAVKI
jgi:hypothetical protein